MAVIQSEHKIHASACIDSEMTRQAGVAAAYAAGGGSAAVATAIRAAEVAHYRRIIASCKANGLPFNNFGDALRDLGTGGA
ncbi:hypothetical protein [Bradyrhizobium sp. RT9a]|uniref:hypothetical protein n=1 Tax=Bradyrhizobium sp. RT9a TaxID=3156384 RepID=UPI0033937395